MNHIERLVEKESKYSEKVPGVKVSTPAQRAMLGYYELLESLFINQMNMAKSGILSQIKAHKIKTIMNPGI
ncbi:hypothetical protein M1146_07355 [Patescibacteria group bacterium]|nr:hypothetical protein [Patescibacteria group bacterium]